MHISIHPLLLISSQEAGLTGRIGREMHRKKLQVRINQKIYFKTPDLKDLCMMFRFQQIISAPFFWASVCLFQILSNIGTTGLLVLCTKNLFLYHVSFSHVVRASDVPPLSLPWVHHVAEFYQETVRLCPQTLTEPQSAGGGGAWVETSLHNSVVRAFISWCKWETSCEAQWERHWNKQCIKAFDKKQHIRHLAWVVFT